MMTIAARRSVEQRRNRACYLFLLFLAGSLVGWIYEEIFYWITEGMLRNRGILYGPWLPIYGIGTLCIYFMKPLKRHPVILFFLCALAAGVVEYLIGFAGIQLFGLRLWDYRGLLWNLDGIICFRSVVSFAVMGMGFLYLLEPAAEHLVKRGRPSTLQTICLMLYLLFLTDCLVSAMFRTPITY